MNLQRDLSNADVAAPYAPQPPALSVDRGFANLTNVPAELKVERFTPLPISIDPGAADASASQIGPKGPRLAWISPPRQLSSLTLPGVEDRGQLSGGFHLYQGEKDVEWLPSAITAGPDGDLWFLLELDNEVAKFDPATHQFTVFTIPSFSPQGITSGPGGDLWFTELTGQIGRLTPDGVLTEYTLQNVAEGITVGKDGVLWFTEGAGIGRLNPADGVVTEFTLPSGNAQGITVAADGSLWFTEETSFTEGNKIGCLSPTGEFREFSVATIGGGALGITAGPDGNIWFTEWDAPTAPGANTFHDKIARITPEGTITEFDIPSIRSGPMGITTGPDGNLWFAEGNGSIGRVTPTGTFTEFKVPADRVEPSGITAGPDGNIWFTSFWSGELGELVLADLASAGGADANSGGNGSSLEAILPSLPDSQGDFAVDLVLSGQNRAPETGMVDSGSNRNDANGQEPIDPLIQFGINAANTVFTPKIQAQSFLNTQDLSRSDNLEAKARGPQQIGLDSSDMIATALDAKNLFASF